jgi:hypothetical protein
MYFSNGYIIPTGLIIEFETKSFYSCALSQSGYKKRKPLTGKSSGRKNFLNGSIRILLMADASLVHFYRTQGIFHVAYRNLQGRGPLQEEGSMLIFSLEVVSGYG